VIAAQATFQRRASTFTDLLLALSQSLAFIVPFRKSQMYRWLLARAVARQALKRRIADMPDRRRWNFPTQQRRRATDA
jgi:hypothetical protein